MLGYSCDPVSNTIPNYLHDYVLESVSPAKCLGVTVLEYLSWSNRINNITKPVAQGQRSLTGESGSTVTGQNKGSWDFYILLVWWPSCIFIDQLVPPSYRNAQVGNYQEMTQSERKSFSKNRGGKTLN